MAGSLKGISGEHLNKIIHLGEKLTIGRGPAGLRLTEQRVSQRHCEILLEGESYRIIDLGSRNGIKINGLKVATAELNPGDVIQIGSNQFEFFFAPTETGVSSWRENLFSLLNRVEDSRQPKTFLPLPFPLKIEVLEGFMAGQVWKIGFGPRLMTSLHTEDLYLRDAVEEIFLEIFSVQESIYLKSLNSLSFIIEGKPFKQRLLTQSQNIRISETLLKIDRLDQQ